MDETSLPPNRFARVGREPRKFRTTAVVHNVQSGSGGHLRAKQKLEPSIETRAPPCEQGDDGQRPSPPQISQPLTGMLAGLQLTIRVLADDDARSVQLAAS